MDELLSEAEARELTAPFEPLWHEAHRSTEAWFWEDFRSSFPDKYNGLTPTARATILNSLIVNHVAAAVGVKMTPAFSFPSQILDNGTKSAIVRFKLLGLDLRPRNHQSGQQDMVNSQTFLPEQLQLAGIAGAPTLLTVGYQLKVDESGMSNVMVVCHQQDELRFSYDVAGATQAVVVELPMQNLPAVARVVSKTRKGNSAEQSTGSEPEE